MSNPNPSTTHLESTQWQPGQSGNPLGKPKGTKHLSTHIREMMSDDGFEQRVEDGSILKGAPVTAVVRTLILKALSGDLRAFDLLARYGYGTKIEFETKELPQPILGGISQLVIVKSQAENENDSTE